MRFIGASILIWLVASLAAFFPPNPALASVVGVSSGSFYFEDASVGDGQIVVNVGDQLRVTVVDGGKGTPHTVEISELGVSSGPLGLNSTYVTPVLSTPGTYTLFCKPHRNKGHWTTLVVLGDVVTTTTTTTTTTPPPTTTTAGNSGTTTPSTTVSGVGPTSTVLPEESGSPSTWATAPTSTSGEAPESPDALGDSAADEVLPSGVTEPEDLAWTRSVKLGFYTLLPLVAIALLALRGVPGNPRRKQLENR